MPRLDDTPKGGQIIDASLVNVSRNRNKRDENKAIKEDKTREDWDGQPSMKCQKDLDACWTKKHGKPHYGYKSYINIDNRDKLIRYYAVTHAAIHDSQIFDEILGEEHEPAH